MILSVLVPGLGHVYACRPVRGFILFVISYATALAGATMILLPSGKTWQGCVLLGLFGLLTVAVARNAYVTAMQRNPPEFEVRRKQIPDPYLSAFLTMMLPGIGHLYLRRWPIGILLVFVSAFIYARSSDELWEGILILYVAFSSFLAFTSPPRERTVDRREAIITILLFVGLSFFIDASFAYVEDHLVTYAVAFGSSNAPTIEPGDVVLICTYAKCIPRRGNLVSIRGTPGTNGVDVIKRLVAFENETVEISNGRIRVNGSILTERPFDQLKVDDTDSLFSFAVSGRSYTLSANSVFVLGDNSSASLDSRTYGSIDAASIDGVVYKTVWPLSRARSLLPDAN